MVPSLPTCQVSLGLVEGLEVGAGRGVGGQDACVSDCQGSLPGGQRKEAWSQRMKEVRVAYWAFSSRDRERPPEHEGLRDPVGGLMERHGGESCRLGQCAGL